MRQLGDGAHFAAPETHERIRDSFRTPDPRRGTQAHEAVAIVLTLIERQLYAQATAHAEEDLSPTLPPQSAISLTSDGMVSCSETVAALLPEEIATLLQQILEATTRIPPGLRYAIARAQREVNGPPFESTEEFFLALARFERGARPDVVSGLVARFEAAGEAAGESTAMDIRVPNAARRRRSSPPYVMNSEPPTGTHTNRRPTSPRLGYGRAY